jgi:hypothetical protein
MLFLLESENMPEEFTEGEFWNIVKKAKKDRKKEFGIDCPGCNIKEPKRIPTKLLPNQKCKVCGYRDPRPYQDLSVYKHDLLKK